MKVFVIVRIQGHAATPFSAHASEVGANERLALEQQGEAERIKREQAAAEEARAASTDGMVTLDAPEPRSYFVGPWPLELEE